MKSKIKVFSNICFWLCIIAALLLVGIVLFAVYLYKVNIISLIDLSTLFTNENGVFDFSVFWTAISAISAVIAVIVAFFIGKRQIEISDKVANIEDWQNRLYIEPHTIVNDISTSEVVWEKSEDGTKIRSIKDCGFPYYTELITKTDLNDYILLKIDFFNTSEAFARLRFDEAQFVNEDKVVAKFNMSTMGTHVNHIVVSTKSSQGSSSVGLLLSKELVKKLRGASMTVSCFLDNNFNNCYRETQSYFISDIVDNKVSFYPISVDKNEFKKIH